jgi:hypothetical protein
MRGYNKFTYGSSRSWQWYMLVFFGFLVVCTFATWVCAITMMTISVANMISLDETSKCKISQCTSGKPQNEIWTCNGRGDCVFVGKVPGLCDPDQNCTQYNSGINYAFNSICYEDLATCDAVTNQIHAYVFQSNQGNTTASSYKIKIPTSIGNDIKVTSRKIGESYIHHLHEWNATITNSKIISAIISPIHIPNQATVIKIDYNGKEIDGTIKHLSSGKLQIVRNEVLNGQLVENEQFDCFCKFHAKIISYYNLQ